MSYIRTRLALVAVLVLATVGCGKSNPDDTASTAPQSSPSPEASAASPSPPDESSSPRPQASSAQESPSPADTRPVVGDIELSAQNVRCTYVPHGNLDGSDSLTVFVYILLIGANTLPGPLRTSVAISNGYSVTYTGGPHNQATSAFQGPIRAGDWGRTLTVDLRTDPDDQYRESEEGNNRIRVSVALPSPRPNQTVDPLPCSAQSS